jgi:hypothetical protein
MIKGVYFCQSRQTRQCFGQLELCVPEFGERLCFCRNSLKFVDTFQIGTKVIELGPVLVCGVQTVFLSNARTAW